MGALGKFLLAAARLAKQGVKEGDILNQAKREFGEVSEFMRAKIRKFYKDKDAPSIKNPSKNADVVPIKKDQGSGIMKTDEASPLMKKMEDVVDTLQKNPKRTGGGLDPVTGITRTLARRILDKKGIEIGKKDPINVFTDTFGESISDVNNLAEEMLEIDRRGGGIKDIDQMLEKDGLFDIKIPTNPQKGLSDDELIDLMRRVDEEERLQVLDDFDPTFRKPNAMGGINRMNYGIGSLPKGIQALVKTINKKFGKDAVKTADEIDRPKNVQAFDDFEARNPDPKKQMTSDVDISQGMIDLDELNFTSNAKAAKEAIDNTSVNKEIKAGVDDIMKDTSPAGLEKSIEVDNLMLKYPGISRDLAKQIANDPDPARKAQVISMVEQTFKMSEKGMSGDEIIDTFKKGTDRTKQANGGLSYLMGM